MPASHASSPSKVRPDIGPAAAGGVELPAAEQLLWHHACCWAEKDAPLVPGYTEVAECFGAIPPTTDQHARFAIRITPDRFGRATASRVAKPGTPVHTRPEPLALHSHRLLDQLQDAVRGCLPLQSGDPRQIRRVSQASLDDERCTVYATNRQAGGLEFEFTVWIDVRRGYAKRIDYHARGFPCGEPGITTAAAVGSRRYRVDGAARWLLVEERERLTFWSASVDLPPRGHAERTIVYSEHWMPAPPAEMQRSG